MQTSLKKHSKMWRTPMAGNNILAARNFSVCSHIVNFTVMGLRGGSI